MGWRDRGAKAPLRARPRPGRAPEPGSGLVEVHALGLGVCFAFGIAFGDFLNDLTLQRYGATGAEGLVQLHGPEGRQQGRRRR